MIEKICGLEIAGKRFETKQTLYFFDGAKEAASKRIALVYGRNGSGKTTIASAFRQVDPMLRDERLSVTIVMDDGSSKLVPQECGGLCNAIHVFDEKYVDEKIKLKSDETGLGTIVLFAEDHKYAQEMESLDQERENVNAEYEAVAAEVSALEDASNRNSPDSLWRQIKEFLKSGWSESDRVLKGAAIKSKVNDDVAKEICEFSCQTSEQDIENEESKARATLEHLAGAGDVGLIPVLPKVAIDSFDESRYLELLNKRISLPRFTDREKSILTVVKRHIERLEEIRDAFIEEDLKCCPYCFREINKSEKILLSQV